MRRFIIIKTSALGDVLHAFDALAYLKERFSPCHITWVVEKRGASLVEAHPDIDVVIPVDTRYWKKNLFNKKGWNGFLAYKKQVQKERYDAAFDLQGNCKSGALLSVVKAKKKVGFGFKTAAEGPNILFTNSRFNPPPGNNIRQDLIYIVRAFFKDPQDFCRKTPIALLAKPPKGLSILPDSALICPGSRWVNKTMPLSRWINILKGRSEKYFLFGFGTEDEKEFCKKLVMRFPQKSALLPKLSLPQLQQVMQEVKIVIAVDSLPLHLAATTNTATFSFFGPSSPHKYGPIGEQHQKVFEKCPYGITFEKRCPKLRHCPTGACLRKE